MRGGGFILLLLMASYSSANTLSPFTTDGCSLWMDGTMQQPNLWRHCCVAHDLAYWLGGTQAKRKKADEDILECVMVAQGSGMAKYMYTNIRWGGSPYWMNHYRWGYGWNYFDGLWPRGYKEPTAEEQVQIDQLLPAALQLVANDARVNPAKTLPPNRRYRH
ncbi:MAG TPA: helicase [Cellvibrio sp.]|nr:helicase [Cellvibrio sp.]